MEKIEPETILFCGHPEYAGRRCGEMACPNYYMKKANDEGRSSS